MCNTQGFKKALALSLALISVVGCEGAPSGTSETTATTLSSSSQAFTLSMTAGIVALAGGATANLGNGMLSVGDTNSEAKRGILSFPITSLSGRTISEGKLTLYFDSQSAQNEVANLGSLTVYRITGTSSPVAADYSAAESSSQVFFSNQTQYATAAQGQAFEIDIKNMLQDAIQAGESHLTLKLRFQIPVNGGNNLISFYAHFNSEALASVRPKISGVSF